MAINIHCVCKSDSHLNAKKCGKCGTPFPADRKYRVVVKRMDGKRVSKVVDTLQQAKKLETVLKANVFERKYLGFRDQFTFGEVWEKYLAWAKGHKKTWRDDVMLWEKHIAPILASKPMEQITALDINGILGGMRSREYAPATVRHVHVRIKRIYNWASQMSLYEGVNPATKIKPPRVNNERTECLSREQIDKLLAVLDSWPNQRLALLVRFALLTGFRRGEVFGLRWDNVDLENGFVTLRDTKGGKDSTLPVSTDALEVLRRAKEVLPSPTCPLVFPNRSGQKRKWFGNSWTAIKCRAGIPQEFRFHGLRHTFASHLASSGKVSMYTLQKLLTHKSPQMTQRYAHLFEQTLRDGVNVLAGIIG